MKKSLRFLVSTGFNTSFTSANYDIVVTPVCQEFFLNLSKNFYLLDRYQKQNGKPRGESTTGAKAEIRDGSFQKGLVYSWRSDSIGSIFAAR